MPSIRRTVDQITNMTDNRALRRCSFGCAGRVLRLVGGYMSKKKIPALNTLAVAVAGATVVSFSIGARAQDAPVERI